FGGSEPQQAPVPRPPLHPLLVICPCVVAAAKTAFRVSSEKATKGFPGLIGVMGGGAGVAKKAGGVGVDGSARGAEMVTSLVAVRPSWLILISGIEVVIVLSVAL